MFFTPFAFFQQPYTVSVLTPSQNYFIGGTFNTYATETNRYFRMLDSTGAISSSFNTGTGFNGPLTTAVTQSDGKIIAGGSFATVSGSLVFFIARLNTNGSLDTSYKTGNGFDASPNSIVIQPDGKAIAVGAYTAYSGSTKNRIVRLNTDGTADTGSSFNIGTGFNAGANAVAYDNVNSRIYVGGTFTTYSGSGATRIACINTNGTIITGSNWNSGAGVNSQVSTLAVQTDGKVVIGGAFGQYSGSAKFYIARINTNGTADTGSSWNQGTGFNGLLNTVKIQSDGKILAVGDFASYSGSASNRIIRLNTDGTRDITFNVGTGFSGTGTATSLDIQPDGKIVVIGQFTSYSGSIANGVVRINTDGTVDSTFNGKAGINTTNGSYGTVLSLSNGSIIIGSNFTGNKVGSLSYLSSTGAEASSNLISSYGVNGNVNNIISQSDGRLLIGGAFTTYSGSVYQSFLARLNTDYSIDTTLNIGIGFNASLVAVTTQSDQKIIVGGAFFSYSGSTVNRIARLNTNGTRDTTFNIGINGFNSTVNALDVQSDQKVIVGGSFTTYSGSTKNYIARLNTDGTADTGSSWNQGTGFNAAVNSTTIQSDQKIVVGGAFTSYSGSAVGVVNRLARLNTNGTRDTTFNIGTAGFNNTVSILAIQSDQKIITGGSFTTYSGSTKNYIARINTDGTADTGSSWNQGTGFNTSVTAILYQPDTKIMVGGNFTSYSGSTANRIVRLNSNGTIDTTFTPTGSGYGNGQVSKIILY